MATPSISIGALADKTGCNVPTIRYYEEIGLLPPALRTAGGHRHCRDFGFPIEQVRELVAMSENGDGNCMEVRDAAQARLAAVQSKLAELRKLEASLAAFVAGCASTCAGGANRDCCIIEDLSAADMKATEIRRPA
jgi:DNA-binding transcriptional MerR regulator